MSVHSTLIDWLIFKGKQIWLEITLSEILLTACVDQLLYIIILHLIKSCPTCAKQIATAKTANDACSMLTI